MYNPDTLLCLPANDAEWAFIRSREAGTGTFTETYLWCSEWWQFNPHAAG